MKLLNRQVYVFTILGTSRGRKEILFPEALVCAKIYAPIETLISRFPNQTLVNEVSIFLPFDHISI